MMRLCGMIVQWETFVYQYLPVPKLRVLLLNTRIVTFCHHLGKARVNNKDQIFLLIVLETQIGSTWTLYYILNLASWMSQLEPCITLKPSVMIGSTLTLQYILNLVSWLGQLEPCITS